MKYVIEKDGSAVSPVSVWTPGLAKKCELPGVAHAPNVPFGLKDGSVLRCVVTVHDDDKLPYQTTLDTPGSVSDEVWIISRCSIDIPVERAKMQAFAKIKVKRDEILEGEFDWSLDKVTYQIQGGDINLTKIERSRDLLIETVKRGVSADNAVIAWRTADNSWTPALTSSQLNDMTFSKGQQILSCWARYRELEGIILSDEIDSVTKLRDLNLDTGWPESGQLKP